MRYQRKNLSIGTAKFALQAYREIPIKFIDVPLHQTLEISYTQNMYAYDAYLIQCAQITSTPLLTLDGGLKNSARELGVQLLEVGL